MNGDFARYTKGEREFVIFAEDVRAIFRELANLHPDLEPHLKDGVAVAIDGKVCQDSWLERVSPDSEVHIFHGIGGG